MQQWTVLPVSQLLGKKLSYSMNGSPMCEIVKFEFLTSCYTLYMYISKNISKYKHSQTDR